MKIQRKLTQQTIVEIEAPTVKETFEALAEAEEIFGIDKCGKCGGTGLRHVVRRVDKYTYYEVQCQNTDCRAKLGLGQPRDSPGSLFPQRKNKKGDYKPNGGWEVYQKLDGNESGATNRAESEAEYTF